MVFRKLFFMFSEIHLLEVATAFQAQQIDDGRGKRMMSSVTTITQKTEETQKQGEHERQ